MKKVLVVEDQDMMADILCEFFQDKGYEVDAVNTLDEAREKLSEVYDIVILDIMLKVGTSFPLLSEIKTSHPETKVYMFSGYDDDEFIKEAKKLGADGFIPKARGIEFLNDFLMPDIKDDKETEEK